MLLLLVGVAALVVGVVALRRTAGTPRLRRRPAARGRRGLRQEVAALRAEARDALRHLAVVRYDAFGDMGGHLSWSLALLDDGGNGVVLTSIHGRSESRTYAKSIAAGPASSSCPPRRRKRSSTPAPDRRTVAVDRIGRPVAC